MQANPNQLHEQLQITRPSAKNNQRPRHAYVTLLHSSEDYVCGAIALAQSIRQTNSTKDLVLLVDNSISDHSILGLQAAGWKVKRIERIRSPHARINAYNEWNYSKLRVWQLTDYDKVMFIDADFIVLHNIDHFFNYPQLSASPNNNWLFNSGIMILEPSKCFFDTLMSKRYTLKSYNGGDQGYLNEVLTWWHRLTTRLNFMKFFPKKESDRSIPEDRHTIHFLGMKPWTCYRDYDCNWDRADYHRYASDEVNARWWQVYDGMSTELQAHCGMTQEKDRRVRKGREIAQKANIFDEHWKIAIKDPRQFQLVSSV